MLAKGAQATANETVAEVSGLLRQSNLPKEFATWVEKNWEYLQKNPKLAPKQTPAVEQAGRPALIRFDAVVKGWIHHVRHADTSGLREHIFAGHALRGPSLSFKEAPKS